MTPRPLSLPWCPRRRGVEAKSRRLAQVQSGMPVMSFLIASCGAWVGQLAGSDRA